MKVKVSPVIFQNPKQKDEGFNVKPLARRVDHQRVGI